MVKKRCPQCGKDFSCEEECVKAGIFIEGVLTERSCFCSKCTRQEDMKRSYRKQLKDVCPRFIESREKVNFT